jgi:prepilin-type processing-associated H-X9-DG protein/prepilin-type N-terminal cleavage/methylation domain-containing protein
MNSAQWEYDDMPNLTSIRRRSAGKAFTLVELLVVIGIIALLISILLPSLAAARRAAQRTACASKLHQIMIGAQMHRQDHMDYYPLAGYLPGSSPEALGDPYTKKYTYYSAGIADSNGTLARVLCPITTALEAEMVGSKALYAPSGEMGGGTNAQTVNAFLDPTGLLAKCFLCPAHATTPYEIQPTFELLWYSGDAVAGTGHNCQPQSYIFNEYILGWNDNPGFGYLKGKATLVHQPAMTMFAADGLGGSTLANHPGSGPLPLPMYTVYPTANQTSATLANALAAGIFGAKAGDKANFDLKRHAGKINIAFCDSHVETRSITAGDLGNVWIMPP